MKKPLGTRVLTGRPCPQNGYWMPLNGPPKPEPIAAGNLMPSNANQEVVWELIVHT